MRYQKSAFSSWGGYKIGESWSTFANVSAGVMYVLPAASRTIEFVPTDPNGQNVAIVDDFFLDATFSAPGDFSGTLSSDPTLVMPSWLTLGSGAVAELSDNSLTVVRGTAVVGADLASVNPQMSVNVSIGANVVFAASQHLDGLTIDDSASATLAAGGERVLRISNVEIGAGARLDLKDNDMIITGMTRSAVESLVQSGFHNGDWLGTGITSSTAAAFAEVDASRMLGVVDNSELGYTTFSGQSVNLTDILVKFTYTGDSNLDGVMDPDDFNQFVYGFNGGPARWLNGDFDFNGVVDPDDFNAFIADFNAFNASGGQVL